MNTINVPLNMAGRYQLVVGKLDADGNEVPGSRRVAVPWFDNLITDAGMDYLGSTDQDNLAMCRIGTGNTAPADADTSLVAQVGTGTTTEGIGSANGYDGAGNYLYRRVSRRFNPGTVDGVNLAEVGMAASNVVNLFSRSLIKDTGGSPTTITLAADEYLDVLYELRLYLPANDATTTATIDGVSTTVTIRYSTYADTLASWSGGLGVRMGMPSYLPGTAYGRAVDTLPAATSKFFSSGSDTNNGTITLASYSPGTYTTTATVVFGPAIANLTGGIQCMLMAGNGSGSYDSRYDSPYGFWAYNFSTKLNKTSTRKATVTVGVTWGRL